MFIFIGDKFNLLKLYIMENDYEYDDYDEETEETEEEENDEIYEQYEEEINNEIMHLPFIQAYEKLVSVIIPRLEASTEDDADIMLEIANNMKDDMWDEYQEQIIKSLPTDHVAVARHSPDFQPLPPPEKDLSIDARYLWFMIPKPGIIGYEPRETSIYVNRS